MPKLEDFSQQEQLNIFFGTTVPQANSPEAKKLVEEAPYHPGYEGAVFSNMTDSTINLSNTGASDTITISKSDFDWSKIAQSYITPLDPKLLSPIEPLDLSKLTPVEPPKKPGSAMKFDGDKLPVNLLSSEALLQTAAVLKFGADKYHAHNWRDGFVWSRPLAAAMRHIMAYNDGEDKDPESGLSHLAHAACCIMFLLEFEKTHPELDDRYKPNVPTVSK